MTRLPTLFFICLTSLLATSFAQVYVSSGLVQAETLVPGETHQGTITLDNESDQPATVRLYQTDYAYSADGTTEYGEPGSNTRSNAPWVILPAATATVPADDGLVLNYRVQVPDDPTLAGSYWSILMVEQLAEAVPESEGAQDEPAVGINTVTRYAIALVTDIGTTGERLLELANPSLQQAEAERGVLFQVDVTNPGERYLQPQVYLELYDESGTKVGRFGDQQQRLLPGNSVRQDFDLGTLTSGEYTAVVIADAGGEDVFGTRYTLNVGDGDTP